jgi:hypothetical protein
MPRCALLLLTLTLSLSWAALRPAVAADGTAPPPLSIHDLADLLGAKTPQRFAAFTDQNENEKYAKGIQVLSGADQLQIGDKVVKGLLLLFVRDGTVGAVKVDQDFDSLTDEQNQQLFDDTVAGLLDSAVKPTGQPGLGGSTSNWGFAHHGWVEVSKAYDSNMLGFYLLEGDMEASYKEYWRNFNAQYDGGFSMF